MARWLRVEGMAVVLAAAGGCASAAGAEPSYRSADPVAQDHFDAARASFAAGRADEAEQRFSSFIVDNPEDPLRHAAELHLGRIAASRGEHDEATTWLELATSSSDEILSTTARRELASSLIESGEPARALEILEPLTGRVEGAEAVALYTTLAEAAAAAGDDGRLLRYLDARHRYERDATVRRQIVTDMQAVAGRGDLAVLDRLRGELPRTGPAWRAVTLRLGVGALSAGDEERVGGLLGELDEAGAGSSEEEAELRRAVEEVRRVDWSAVGALLPLSGRARLVGERVLAGLDLAAESGPDEESPIRLITRDTTGADVARLVTELVETERVSAIVGPVDAAAAEVAARRAQELGVPLLALTIRQGVTDAGQWVLRPFQSNEAEVRALVGHATGDLGLRSFAVLHPDSGYGRVLLRIVEQEVTERGGTVVTVQSYDPTRTSFVEECQELSAHEFEALIVTDRSRLVSLVAPSLAAAGLWSQPSGGTAGPEGTRPVQILLPAVAFDERVVRQAGRYLQGAIFATPLWTGDSSPATTSFVERYRGAHGAEPSALASQAHDAVQLVRAARHDATVRTRTGLLEALADLETAATAGPFGGFHPSGEPRTPVRLVTIRGEEVQALP